MAQIGRHREQRAASSFVSTVITTHGMSPCQDWTQWIVFFGRLCSLDAKCSQTTNA